MKTYEIDVSFHCSPDESPDTYYQEIVALTTNNNNPKEDIQHTNDNHIHTIRFVFNTNDEYRSAVSNLKNSIYGKTYHINVIAHILENEQCEEHEEFENNIRAFDDLLHLSDMVSEMLIRMTNDPDNSAFVLSFAAGRMVSDFNLEASEILDAFDMGFADGEEIKSQAEDDVLALPPRDDKLPN